MSAENENALYDRFLIEDTKAEKEKQLEVRSYRNDLLKELKERREGVFDGFTENDMYNIVKFREVIKLAHDNGICISQLTKL